MALDANSFPFRDSSTGAPVEPPTVGCASVRGLIAGLEALGYRSSLLLSAAGLHAGDLDDPDAHFPCSVFPMMIGEAIRQRPQRNLSLKTAMATPGVHTPSSTISWRPRRQLAMACSNLPGIFACSDRSA
jgi:hypothetical protein